MFDGTDLSMAYSSMYEPEPMMQPSIATMPQQSAPQPPVMEMAKAAASHAQPPEIPYNPPSAMYAQQSPQAEPTIVHSMQPTFWERLADKKADVLKLVALSIVVLIAISADRMISHYLGGYISKAFLTDMQELLVRLAYPIGAILVLWILKASA